MFLTTRAEMRMGIAVMCRSTSSDYLHDFSVNAVELPLNIELAPLFEILPAELNDSLPFTTSF